MFNPVLLMVTLILSSPAFAEEREVANENTDRYETVSDEFSSRSFFEPKTAADVNALATLDRDFKMSLDVEPSN